MGKDFKYGPYTGTEAYVHYKLAIDRSQKNSNGGGGKRPSGGGGCLSCLMVLLLPVISIVMLAVR